MQPNPAAIHAMKLIRETVELDDGRKVVLRPIRPDDAPLLVHLHERLSKESQYMRFFGPKPELSAAEADYLAKVDHSKRFAIVAVVSEDDADRIVAVGRFDLTDTDVAEPAIVVRDDYQGSGLGRAILERLLEVARGRGIEHFRAEILAENEKMLQILRANGLEVGTPSGGIVYVTAPIADAPLLFRGLKTMVRFTSSLTDAIKRRRAGDGEDE